MYRNAEGQPTFQEMLEAHERAIKEPTTDNLESLGTLLKTRTTYWGRDYQLGHKIDDFLRRYNSSPFWN